MQRIYNKNIEKVVDSVLMLVYYNLIIMESKKWL